MQSPHQWWTGLPVGWWPWRRGFQPPVRVLDLFIESVLGTLKSLWLPQPGGALGHRRRICEAAKSIVEGDGYPP